MTLEEDRQSAKEQAILLALKHGMALLREELKIYGMKADGSKEYICTGKDYDHLWQDALHTLKIKSK